MSQNLPQGIAELGARTPDQIRDAHLRDIVNTAIDAGRTPPDISPGSFDHIRSTAISNHLALIEANGLVIGQQLFLDGAVGDDLDHRAGLRSVYRRPKSGSIGTIILNASAQSPVAVGTQLTSTTGLRFQVTTGGLFSPGDKIEIAAIDTGAATNLPAGSLLQWSNAPPYSDAKATVAAGGLVNGTEDETDDELRNRVLDGIRNPATESNAQAISQRAEASTPSVQKAFVYMALLGPSTYALAVSASPTATNKSRQVAASTVTNVVAPIVAGSHFDAVYPQISSVVDDEVTYLSIGLSLPASRSAPTPGIGGGWVNGTPWPAAEAVNSFRCTVTAVTSPTSFTVNATAAPTPSVTKISWLSPVDWTLYTATIIDVSSVSGAWIITLDKPFTGITVGCVIWPTAERQDAYAAALLKAFALMGPGEMSNQASVLKRSARFPSPAQSWPYSLNASQLRAISDTGGEVLSARYLVSSKYTPTVSGSAPRILTPKHVGFYPNQD